MTEKASSEQVQAALALYPIEEIKRLYEEQAKYAHAREYIQYLEQQNQYLNTEINLLKQQVERLLVWINCWLRG